MYLNLFDYTRQIQADQLTQLTGNSTSVRLMTEMAALAEVKSYLVQMYDCAAEFTDMAEWSHSVSYKALQRFFLKYTTFSAASTYAVNDKVTYLGLCYICTTAVPTAGAWNASNWTLLGNENDIYYGKLPAEQYDYYFTYKKDDVVFYKNKTYTAKKPSKEVLPDSSSFGFEYWGNGTAYSIPAGTLPTDINYFVLGDNRSQQLVQIMIDVSIYHVESRINPRNIPQLRLDRYDAAIAWLKDAGGQNNAITADIPKLIPMQGSRTRFGGVPKNVNHY